MTSRRSPRPSLALYGPPSFTLTGGNAIPSGEVACSTSDWTTMQTTRGVAARPSGSGRLRPRLEACRRLSSLFRLILRTISLILVGLCVSTGMARAQVGAGNVSSLVGSASVQRAGTSIDVSVGMAVQVADQVVVSTGGKVTITLSDGSILEVGSSSTLVLDEELLGPGGARASTRVHLLAGLAFGCRAHFGGYSADLRSPYSQRHPGGARDHF